MKINQNRDAKPRRRKRVGAKREKGDALIAKIEQSKNSNVLKVIRNDGNLVDLIADVRSITRIRTDEMILKLKRDQERKGATYKSLTEKVLGEWVEVTALTAQAPLKVKNLDGVAEVEELTTAL